jgi:regulatory protein
MKNTDDLQKRKYWNKDEAYTNIKRYCAFQERCHSEVRSKLLEHGIFGDLLEELIAKLITENFLNEERFAIQFAGGKFRMKQWGKVKITHELKLRKVSEYCIKSALDEIDAEQYLQSLSRILENKKSTLQGLPDLKTKGRLTEFALSKGYSYEDIQKVLNPK